MYSFIQPSNLPFLPSLLSPLPCCHHCHCHHRHHRHHHHHHHLHHHHHHQQQQLGAGMLYIARCVLTVGTAYVFLSANNVQIRMKTTLLRPICISGNT